MNSRNESGEFGGRYMRIDEANEKSFYMTDPNRPFTVNLSLYSAGEPRQKRDSEDDYLNKAGIAARFVLGGNMSTVVRNGEAAFGPSGMTSDERLADARFNMSKHFEALGIDPSKVKILNPERDYSTPLTAVNADEDKGVYNGLDPVRLQKSGDFVYSYNPDIILAARPADCPIAIMSAETPNGKLNMLLHFAWKGPASGQYEDMKRELDILGIKYESLRVYISPGGQSETFRYESYKPNGDTNPYIEEGRLFVGITERELDDKTKVYDFGIDTPNDVYEAFMDLGLDKSQVFLDTSDTTALNSGYSSNSRAFNQKEDNVRDILTAQFEAPNDIILNPNNSAPPEVEKQITTISVEYIDFDGNKNTGLIEVNKAVAKDVQEFFELAVELKFPIEKVVRSSDKPFLWNDDMMMAANMTSGFNYRLIKDTDTVSFHGLGQAFDVNTRLNPYIRYYKDGSSVVDPEGATYNASLPGVFTADHPLVVFMKDRGWEWGGDWTPEEHGAVDYQHFQKPIL